MLNAFSAWNLSVDELSNSSRGGIQQRYKLLKWEFYTTAAEEMMPYVDMDEIVEATEVEPTGSSSHVPNSIPKNFRLKYPQCIISSIKKSVSRRFNQKKYTGK